MLSGAYPPNGIRFERIGDLFSPALCECPRSQVTLICG